MINRIVCVYYYQQEIKVLTNLNKYRIYHRIYFKFTIGQVARSLMPTLDSKK